MIPPERVRYTQTTAPKYLSTRQQMINSSPALAYLRRHHLSHQPNHIPEQNPKTLSHLYLCFPRVRVSAVTLLPNSIYQTMAVLVIVLVLKVWTGMKIQSLR